MPELQPLHIAAIEGAALLCLKSWLPGADFAHPVVLAGRELPSEVGETLPRPIRVLCIAPGEWLIVSREHSAASLREHVAPDLPEQGYALIDLSDGLVGLEVRGAMTRELLSKGCGLDLNPRSFPAGRCARTRFAQMPVVVECLDEPPRFDLYVFRSYRQYLRDWLVDAAAEF